MRKIATEKMFLIHNTLGEDSKIFDPEEQPTASRLFEKVMANPEEAEVESFQTQMRLLYQHIVDAHPETIERTNTLPSRLKVAKAFNDDALLVFIQKGLGLFIRGFVDSDDKVEELVFENILNLIQCELDEPAVPFSQSFWERYTEVKELKNRQYMPTSEQSVEKKALNTINTLLKRQYPHLVSYTVFLQNLREDMLEYKTLSDYTLRSISTINSQDSSLKNLRKIEQALKQLKKLLGEDYLDRVKLKLGQMGNEVIIAIENVKEEA